MRTFRNPFLNWLAENPGLAAFAFIGLVILLLALVPIFLYLMPIRKVPIIYNIRNLQSRWKTTIVTALAFTLVTTLLTFMLSFVKGMDRLIEASGDPGNVMILSDGATDEAFSNLGNFAVEQLPGDLQAQIDFYVKEVYVVVMYMVPDPLPGARPRRFVQMRGLDNMPKAALMHGVELTAGHSWVSDAGAKSIGPNETAKEIVLGHGVARAFGEDLGKSIVEPGDVIRLGPAKWVVVGVMQEGSAAFGSEIWTRDQNVMQTFGRENSYSSYVIRIKDGSIERAKKAVAALKDVKIERNFQVFTEKEYYAKMSDTSKQFSAASYVVAFIMAIGGILGVMNTMYAAISQRSKDIGVLRLMGYRRWQILLCFQFEALLIAILGGIVGCLIAFLLFNGMTVTSIISSGAGGGGKTVVLRLIVDGGVLFTGMVFSILMGALGGLIPALSAMRLQPLESLK
ncbi:MAG: ABC transporter permease [Planctomycetes bacterium]|nr:ABC transporter permease [Planctomycetota bacterium]